MMVLAELFPALVLLGVSVLSNAQGSHFNPPCSAYENTLTVERLSVIAFESGLAINWGLQEDLPPDCVRGFLVRLCAEKTSSQTSSASPPNERPANTGSANETASCAWSTKAADDRGFWMMGINRTTFLSSSVIPLLMDGKTGRQRSVYHEDICSADFIRVKNLTMLTTAKSFTLTWLPPDLAADCVGGYDVTVFQGTRPIVRKHYVEANEARYTKCGLEYNSLYRATVRVLLGPTRMKGYTTEEVSGRTESESILID